MRRGMVRAAVLTWVVSITACGGGAAGGGDPAGGGTGATAGQRDAAGNCVPVESTCSQAEQDDYSSCLLDMCDAEYKACFGDGYRVGKYSGPCGTWLSCTNACDCADNRCKLNCGSPAGECATCSLTLSGCLTKCSVPECLSGGATGGGSTGGVTAGGSSKTCAELKACCDAKTDTAAKSMCEQYLMGAMSVGDVGCNAIYSSVCP